MTVTSASCKTDIRLDGFFQKFKISYSTIFLFILPNNKIKLMNSKIINSLVTLKSILRSNDGSPSESLFPTLFHFLNSSKQIEN